MAREFNISDFQDVPTPENLPKKPTQTTKSLKWYEKPAVIYGGIAVVVLVLAYLIFKK